MPLPLYFLIVPFMPIRLPLLLYLLSFLFFFFSITLLRLSVRSGSLILEHKSYPFLSLRAPTQPPFVEVSSAWKEKKKILETNHTFWWSHFTTHWPAPESYNFGKAGRHWGQKNWFHLIGFLLVAPSDRTEYALIEHDGWSDYKRTHSLTFITCFLVHLLSFPCSTGLRLTFLQLKLIALLFSISLSHSYIFPLFFSCCPKPVGWSK